MVPWLRHVLLLLLGAAIATPVVLLLHANQGSGHGDAVKHVPVASLAPLNEHDHVLLSEAHGNDSVVLLAWTPIFGQTHTWQNGGPIAPPSCPQRCTMVVDRKYLPHAKMVLFHARDIKWDELPPRDVNGIQPWTLVTMETPVNDVWPVEHPDRVRLFDYVASYRHDSDFPMTYEYLSQERDVRSPPYVPIDRRVVDAPVVWVASNCEANNKRHAYIQRLMGSVSVHSYGNCLRNRDWPQHEADLDPSKPPLDDRNKRKPGIIELMRHYKFYLAVENSNCLDYVSEKLFNTFSAGIVPIVNGPREMYAPYLPFPDSALFLDEYDSPEDLARHIRYLDGNDTAYAELTRYKTTPDLELSPLFLNRTRELKNRRSTYCLMCMQAHADIDAENAFNSRGRVVPPIDGDPSQLRSKLFSPIHGHVARPDNSCEENVYAKYYVPSTAESWQSVWRVALVSFIALIVLVGVAVFWRRIRIFLKF